MKRTTSKIVTGSPKGAWRGKEPFICNMDYSNGASPLRINQFIYNKHTEHLKPWHREYFSSFDNINFLLSHFDQWNIFSIFDCCETIQICILFNKKILLRSPLRKRNHSKKKIFWFFRHLTDRSKIEIFSSKIFEKSENFSSLFFEFWNFFFFFFVFLKFFFCAFFQNFN